MSIPFDIPARLMLRYASGDLIRSGALLREASSGRIVAHLQETAGLARMMGGSFNPVGLAANGLQIYQNEQIKAGLEVVKNLGIANLALTGISIGVSVAGFAVLATKLCRIEAGIDELGAAIERVSHKVDRVRDHLVRQELADLRAELRRIDGAWILDRDDAQVAQWREAGARLLTIEERFHGHARALAASAEDPRLRDLMIDAYVLAAEGRRSALLAAGDEGAAEKAALDFHHAIDGLTTGLGAADLLREMIASEDVQGLAARADAVERLRPQAEARAAILREREELAATAPLTIAALREAGVAGRTWLEHARRETEAPLMFLPVEGMSGDGCEDP